jgi:hypothetical protein
MHHCVFTLVVGVNPLLTPRSRFSDYGNSAALGGRFSLSEQDFNPVASSAFFPKTQMMILCVSGCKIWTN